MEKIEIKEKCFVKLKLKPHLLNMKEDYLKSVLEDAISDVEEFINADVSDEKLITPICDLCVIRVNTTGNEGVISSSKAGQSETFLEDIPKSIKNKLRKFRVLP